MRRVGDPRAIAVVERGLRGSPLLPRNSFIRSSFSGAPLGRGGGRGRGIGTAEEDGFGRVIGRGRGGAVFHQEIVEESYVKESRFVELGEEVPKVSRAMPVGAGRGRGVPHAPLQETTRDVLSALGPEQFGKGRVSPPSPQQTAGRGTPFVQPHDEGTGRRSSPLPLSFRVGSLVQSLPPGGDVDVLAKADEDLASPNEDIVHKVSEPDQSKSDEAPKLDPKPDTGERKLSAVEKLLLGLGLNEPKVTTSPETVAQAEKRKMPFKMPFDRSPSPIEQKQSGAPKPIFKTANLQFGAVGRGRGQSDVATKPSIGFDPEIMPPSPGKFDRMPECSQPLVDPEMMQSPPSMVDRMSEGLRDQSGSVKQPSFDFEPDVMQQELDTMPGGSRQEGSPQRLVNQVPGISSPGQGDGSPWQEPFPPRRFDGMPESSRQSSPSKRFDRAPDSGRKKPVQPPSPRLQLTVEEARARAMSILEQGLEKNVAAEGERRRKAGIEKFADAAEFLADKLRREPGQPPSQTQRPRSDRERSTSSRRSDRPRRQRSANEVAVAEPEVDVQLTPEQEEKILKMQEEDTFKERLHTLFLLQFEPEYAMEDFGTNPYIDEPPVLPLEEYLHALKPMFVSEDADLSEEQQWEEAVKSSVVRAPNLEKLVEAYAGPGRMTAREQIGNLQKISEKLPPSATPEVTAFTQRALITLQNNPGLRFRDKERLMTRIVSGFSSG